MALLNKTPEVPIRHPNKEGVWVEVAAVYLIPTQIQKKTTNVQAMFLVESVEEVGATYIDGYKPAQECGPFNLGEAETHMGSLTYKKDLHDFAIQVLGSNFTKK